MYCRFPGAAMARTAYCLPKPCLQISTAICGVCIDLYTSETKNLQIHYQVYWGDQQIPPDRRNHHKVSAPNPVTHLKNGFEWCALRG